MKFIMTILVILALIGGGMASTVSSRATAQADDGFQMQATSTSPNVVVTVLELPHYKVDIDCISYDRICGKRIRV